MHVFTRVWLYSDPEKLDQVNRLLADYLNERTSWIGNRATWTAEPVSRSVQESMASGWEIPQAAKEAPSHPNKNMVFSSVMVRGTFTLELLERQRLLTQS